MPRPPGWFCRCWCWPGCVPYLLRGGRLGRQSLPLLAFLSAAFLSAAAAFFLTIPSFRDFHLARSELEALVTLGMGACFYLVVSAWAVRQERLGFLLRWVNWTGLVDDRLVAPAGACLPADAWLPDLDAAIQALVCHHRAVCGARQRLCLSNLPGWRTSSTCSTCPGGWRPRCAAPRVHRWRLGPLTFERFLLLGGVLALVLSVSRIGLLGFLLMIAFLLLLGVVWLVALAGRAPAGAQPAAAARGGDLARYGLRVGLLLGCWCCPSACSWRPGTV